ncbi:MAG: ABC transporter permease, partial [Nitrosopumilus sp.]|nr:ABC transporter permease [Nitrosopumilus sp.]
MSSITSQEIKQEFLKSKTGIVGITILIILITISIAAIIMIPIETFQEWNNPGNWISYPKVAIPAWVNLFITEKIPEHKILDNPNIQTETHGEIFLTSHQFGLNFNYDDFPNDFIYLFSSEYSGSPLLQISVIRPDGINLELLSTSLPYLKLNTIHDEQVFSTDESIKKKYQCKQSNS